MAKEYRVVFEFNESSYASLEELQSKGYVFEQITLWNPEKLKHVTLCLPNESISTSSSQADRIADLEKVNEHLRDLAGGSFPTLLAECEDGHQWKVIIPGWSFVIAECECQCGKPILTAKWGGMVKELNPLTTALAD